VVAAGSSRGLHLLLEIAQLLERATAPRPRLCRVLTTKIPDRASYLFRNVAHAAAGVAARLRTAVCLLVARRLAAGLLTLRLLAFRLLTFRLSTVCLSTVFPRDLLELLSQLVLLARELLELTLQLGLAHLPPLELLLLLEQLVLPPRELADLVERARARLIFLLRAGRRLVIGLLRPLQLLAEERRDVVIPVVIAGAARTGLLACHLPSLHIGLRLEEMIQRFHLRRQRVCSF